MTISNTPSPFKSAVRGEDWEPTTGKSFCQTTEAFFLVQLVIKHVPIDRHKNSLRGSLFINILRIEMGNK
jgi:hypothetical protein